MKQSAVVAETPARLLLKKREVCSLLNVGPAKLEAMLDAGRLPPPVWLGETPNSRRWPFAIIKRYVASLAKAADRTTAHA
jgi:predicted DNA-binding transcriptional regulator AlpA